MYVLIGAVERSCGMNCRAILIIAVFAGLQGCSYTRQPGAIEQGSEVGGTGDVGFSHEDLGANKHLVTVTATPGLMET